MKDMLEKPNKISVLGTTYQIEWRNLIEDATLIESDGYCDDSAKKIVLSNDERALPGRKGNLAAVRRKQLRHEIIHAFLSESGLAENSDWAQNEEVVDWMAIQFPKLIEVFGQAGCLR